jgi:hypothetical protein
LSIEYATEAWKKSPASSKLQCYCYLLWK